MAAPPRGAWCGVPAAGPFVCWDLETVMASLVTSASAQGSVEGVAVAVEKVLGEPPAPVP